MKNITPNDKQIEPAAKLECSNGHQFWVDPCGEENLEWSEKFKSLKAVCPECGEREDEEKGKII